MKNHNQLSTCLKWFIFLFLINYSIVSTAQCAGNNITITICDKFGDTNNQTYDLFAVPGFNGTPGGIWSTTNPANFFALDQNTGELNLWSVNSSGSHQFTYTNNACGQSAIITIDLGGYSGVDNLDGSANACSDNNLVNLNGFIGDQSDGKIPDINGLWEEDPSTATGFLNNNFFDATMVMPGEYLFTYTLAAVGSCPASVSNVKLEVHPRAESGEGTNLTLCNNEDFSLYTSFNLNNLLAGEDVKGTWSESSTNQLSDLSDNIVDIQDIYNTHGIGEYAFTYLVNPFPNHPICSESRTTVQIIILPTLDGTMDVENYCVSQNTYPVSLTYDNTLLPDGIYNIWYSYNGTSIIDPVSATLTNGTGSFNLEINTTPVNQSLTLSIVDIAGTLPSQAVCPAILVPDVSFLVSAATAVATDTCINTDATVNLSNIFDATEVLSNQTHTVNYILTDPNNVVSNLTDSVSFIAGIGNLIIPGTNFTDGGVYTIEFDIIGGLDLGCTISTSKTITPLPSEIQLDLIVDNNCNASQIDVIIDAPILSGGTYDIVYDVIEQTTNTVLTQNNINFAGGTADYQIDVSALTQGNYTVRVRSSQNDATPCRLQFDFELTENFAIMGTPSAPVADALQNFCLNNYDASGPTLEDIAVTANGTILFYDTATDLNILPIATPLVDGEDYFISNTDLNNNCEGSDRIQVVTTLSNPIIPTTTQANPEFCEADNPTIANLSVDVINGATVVWYDALTGGNLLDNSTALQNGTSYFASTASADGCHGTQRLEIITTIHTLEPASIEFTTLSICGLDNPTIENLRALEDTNSFEVQWYDEPENGTPLNFTTLLVTDTTYYAESFNPVTGCRNPERIAVTVDLTNCDPEQYGYFIPDGFSPNGDGRNDRYFVPNIEIIFPDFTMEIVNRYGSTMFIGGKNNPSWDGSNNGNSIAPNGVYFYIINYNKDGFKPLQGRLYLNR